MRVAVVYESLMGNTRRVAEAIAAGARDAASDVDVSCSPAGDARSGDADLLIVDAPTHFLGVPRARTRRLWVNGLQKACWVAAIRSVSVTLVCCEGHAVDEPSGSVADHRRASAACPPVA